MAILPLDKNFAQLKPLFLPTPFWIAHRVKLTPHTEQFNVGQNQFGALATEETFIHLRTHLLEINIEPEIMMLNEDRYLEITLPVLNFTDLMNRSFKSRAQKFPCVVGINGFGAKTSFDAANNFSRPDFMSVTDLLGNQYEILPQANGTIHLPQEGAGRFTLIKAITCIYSAEQLQGRGLADLKRCQLTKNSLYVLPPIDTIENFSLKIAVVDLSKGQREVESIRTVKVAFKDNAAMDYTAQVMPKTHSTHLMAVETRLPMLKRCVATLTFKKISTLKLAGNEHEKLANSWLPHPFYPHVVSKRLGLNHHTLRHIIRQLYSQCDLMRDYLAGDNFSLMQHQQYNDFLLRPESFEVFYDALLHHVAYYKQGEFIFSHVPVERILELSLLNLPVDFHDSVVLAQLQEEIIANNIESFKKIFTQYESLQQETFYIDVDDTNEAPSVEINVFYDVHFLENKLKNSFASPQEVIKDMTVTDLYQLPFTDMSE